MSTLYLGVTPRTPRPLMLMVTAAISIRLEPILRNSFGRNLQIQLLKFGMFRFNIYFEHVNHFINRFLINIVINTVLGWRFLHYYRTWTCPKNFSAKQCFIKSIPGHVLRVRRLGGLLAGLRVRPQAHPAARVRAGADGDRFGVEVTASVRRLRPEVPRSPHAAIFWKFIIVIIYYYYYYLLLLLF
jgi:hypothetical protein